MIYILLLLLKFMRVALYNQMFGMNGKNLFSFLLAHYRVHFYNTKTKVVKGVYLDKTIETIKKADADIIGITEILEGQEIRLKKMLNKLGYKYIFFEKGHKSQVRKLYINIAIASKLKCEKIKIEGFPVKHEMGGGGGIINCYFPSIKTNLINLHLALSRKRINSKQIKFIISYLSKLKNKIILMGDFNLSNRKLRRRFKYLSFISEGIKTCPITYGIGFLRNDIDHIFVRGYKKTGIGEITGNSDHKLIYADII